MDYLDDPTVQAVCAICRQPVRAGQDVISIQRNVEHIEADGLSITVKDSVLLASLCASCAPKYPEGKIRVIFG